MIKNKKINFRIILIIIGVVFLLFVSKEVKTVESFSNLAFKPFASFFSEMGYWFNDKTAFFSNIKETKIENDKLVNENLKLRFQLTKLKELKNENELLREEINLNEKVDFNTEATLIIGQNLSQNRRVVYLDKGSRNGLSEGDPIIVSEGFLIGRIINVHTTTAEAELILDKNVKINAEIQEIGIKGIIRGEFGTSVAMEMIPQSAEVREKQTVITSGLGGEFPRGLLVGYVEEIKMSMDKLFQEVSLKSPINFNDLRLVWVIKSDT